MRNFSGSYALLFFLWIRLMAPLSAQDTDVLFREELRNFVAEKIAEHGPYIVLQEKYILSLISLTNEEMRSRIGDVKRVREAYFMELNKDLDQLNQLETRLNSQGIRDFDGYIQQLRTKIKNLMNSGSIDYRRKRILEDALQLLVIAEEMTRMSGVSGTGPASRKQYEMTRQKLEETLGNGGSEGGEPGKVPTLYDLYLEWLRLNLTEFQAKILKVKLYRDKLLTISNRQQQENMLRNQLELAFVAFNNQDYELAALLMEDLIVTYEPLGFDLSDVYYYAGESYIGSERYPEAMAWFQQCHSKFPGTEYDVLSLVRLLQIAFVMENDDLQEKYFEEYLSVAPLSDPYREELILSMAVSRFNRNQFQRAIALLQEVGVKSENYFMAQYVIAKSYAAAGNYEEAKNILKRLAGSKNIDPQLFYRIVLKYAMILYEEGDFQRAITLLQRIGEEFEQFDLVLDVLAWAEFQYQQSLPIQEQNYKNVLDYIDLALDKYYGTQYELELKALRAYILEITNHPVEAVDQYEEVYLSKRYKELNDHYLMERDSLRQLLLQTQDLKFKAINRSDKESFGRLARIEGTLGSELDAMNLIEMSAEGERLYSELSKILRQLKEIERLKALAQEKKDEVLVKRLEDLEVRLNAVIASSSVSEKSLNRPYNYFEMVPSSKWVSEITLRNEKILQTRKNLHRELESLQAEEQMLDREMERARLMQDDKKYAALSRQKMLLDELKGKYQRLLSLAYSMEILPIGVELNKWADLGGFGVINVNFSQRKKAEEAITYNAGLIQQIEEEFRLKKNQIEEKIKLIEAQIKIMTMRAREEERKRVRAERERSFREGYFDTRTSEFEPLQPEIQLEGAPLKEEQPQEE